MPPWLASRLYFLHSWDGYERAAHAYNFWGNPFFNFLWYLRCEQCFDRHSFNVSNTCSLFSKEDPDAIRGGVGMAVCALLTYVNHSCEPNASSTHPVRETQVFPFLSMEQAQKTLEDMMEECRKEYKNRPPLYRFDVKAKRDIKAGEQIFISYCATDKSKAKRMQSLQKYGILCKCSKCERETITEKERKMLSWDPWKE